MTASPPPSSTPPDDPTAARLRREPPDDDENLDAQLQLAQLRRKIIGTTVAPVRFRQWELERRLGRGGMGSVYLARDPKLERRVALKVLGRQSGPDRSPMNDRLRREAQALAQIQHEHVVKVHSVDLDRGRTVIEMEYIDGLTLRQWRQTKRTWREIVRVYAEAAQGLAAIHAADLIHRDVKPDNLLIDGHGCVKVVDLGLAIGARPAPASAPAAPRPPARGLLEAPLTAASTIVGTPGYMAPELYGHAEASPACDQFGFSVSLWETLFGELPFTGTTPEQYAAAMRQGPVRPPDPGPSVPRWVLGALRRGLRFDPGERYPSMTAMAHALRHGLAQRRRWLLGGLVSSAAIALATTAGVLGWRFKDPAPDPCDALARELTLDRTDAPLHAITANPLAFAPPARTIASFEQAVRTSTEQWVRSQVALCHAQTIADDPLHAHKRRCLDHVDTQRRAELAGVAHATDDLAGRLINAQTAIERLPHCDDQAELRHWASSADHAPIADQIASALALERAGDYARAQEQAQAAVDASEAASSMHAHADALYRLGHILGAQDRSREAFAVLDRARNAAFAIAYDPLVCEAIVYQAKLSAAITLDPITSARDLGQADACLQRLDTDFPILHADLLEAHGLLAQAAGHPNEARAWHQKALERRQTDFGPTHNEVSRSLHNLANAQAESADYSAALHTIDRALAIREQWLGRDHPKVAAIHFDRADILRSLDRLDDARDAVEHAQQIYHQRGLATGPEMAGVHQLLADLDQRAGHLDLASAHLDQARALHNADPNLSPTDPSRAYLAQLEGVIQIHRHDFGRAFDCFARATEILRRHNPTSDQVLDSVLREVEMLYGLEAHARLTERVTREDPWLADYLTHVSEPAKRGRFGWYIGDSCLRQQHYACATTYTRIALHAYQQLHNPDATAQLQAQLDRSLAP